MKTLNFKTKKEAIKYIYSKLEKEITVKVDYYGDIAFLTVKKTGQVIISPINLSEIETNLKNLTIEDLITIIKELEINVNIGT